MRAGASSVLGPLRPPPHGRGGLLRFGTNKTATAWVSGPPPFWDHRRSRHMGAGASFTFETN